MPVRFQTTSESEGVIVKKLSVSDDGGTRTGSIRNKFTINIRIFPHKKQRPKVAQSSSKINFCLRQHRCHHPQQHSGRPTTAKRTRFSCWSAEEDDSHLHHYDVAANDVTYWSTPATASHIPHSSCDDYDDSRLQCCNYDKDADDDYDEGRRRRSYKTAQNFVFTGQCDAAAAGDSDLDEVFEDLAERTADSGQYREALRPMNAGSAPDQRRQRVSQPLPPRHRPGGHRAGASNAVTAQGPTERKPALRRALTDLEAAEIAAGYPEVYYVGDTATVNAAENVRRRAAAKKTQDSGSVTREEETKKTYDDEEGYYIHVPHDQIAYR